MSWKGADFSLGAELLSKESGAKIESKTSGYVPLQILAPALGSSSSLESLRLRKSEKIPGKSRISIFGNL